MIHPNPWQAKLICQTAKAQAHNMLCNIALRFAEHGRHITLGEAAAWHERLMARQAEQSCQPRKIRTKGDAI